MVNLTAQLKESQFDFVHHSQAVFRVLMMSLAFPGKIGQLQKVNLATQRYESVLQCMLSLLDLETSFAVIADNTEECDYVAKYLKINTGSHEHSLFDANFILCLTDGIKGDFLSLKQGSLEHPDQSATVFYHVDSISDQPESEHHKVTLKGPGIKTETDVFIKGLDIEELQAWKQSRGHYPLGCDVFCVTTQGQLIGIPRSVEIVSINE